MENILYTNFNDLYKWDQRFLKLAFEVATWSKDPSSQVGSVIAKKKKFISLGFNGPPSGVIDDPTIERERKYKRTIHAEKNSLFHAKKTKNSTIYVTHFPCSQCACGIIQKKITRVVVPQPSPEFYSRWVDDITESHQLFNEAGVIVEIVIMEK